MSKIIISDESQRLPKFERVVVAYKCGCSFYNDSWKSACDSDALCPEHKQSIKAETGEWVIGLRPDCGKTNPHTFKTNVNIKMLDAERVGKDVICPKCSLQFPIKEHVVPAPKGSGGCKAFATCPNCGYESCANSDSCDNEPDLSI